MHKTVDRRRITIIRGGELTGRTVLYWMSRDQRVTDNWALLYAQEVAIKLKQPLIVMFSLAPAFLGATIRQYGFMLRGLHDVAQKLHRKNIPFILLFGQPSDEVPAFVSKHNIGLIVTDFDPLRIKLLWKEQVSRLVVTPFHEVDAHNIVPCRLASAKQEYAAYTIRPKINRLLGDFLTPFSTLKKHPYNFTERTEDVNWPELIAKVPVDRSVQEVSWIVPGENAALAALRSFIADGSGYAEKRNDPAKNGQSGLSPYLHFGQISAQRVALEVMRSKVKKASRDAFLEELIIRRELADNFCLHNSSYDSFDGFPEWAQTTLMKHLKDRREYTYSLSDFEQAKTHDDLWNAAQREMVIRGKMHGYMRMYWAKKILEWTGSAKEALEIAITLNDRYELDGRDPNGYAGIAWSIGGVHDRAWGERPIFGKVRYMSYKGCRSKFDVPRYIKQIADLKDL